MVKVRVMVVLAIPRDTSPGHATVAPQAHLRGMIVTMMVVVSVVMTGW